MLDLVLAVFHHVLIFGLFGLLVAELMVVKRGMDIAAVRYAASIDLWYGILAGLIIAVGFGRAVFAAKGWDYYSRNGFFWGKIATFTMIGLLSAAPTIFLIKARRAGVAPPDAQVDRARLVMQGEIMLFPLLLAFGAAMARGYGAF